MITGAFPAGVARLAGDGRDDAGREVPTGAYFYRLESMGRASTGRTVRVR